MNTPRARREMGIWSELVRADLWNGGRRGVRCYVGENPLWSVAAHLMSMALPVHSTCGAQCCPTALAEGHDTFGDAKSVAQDFTDAFQLQASCLRIYGPDA